MPLGTFRNALSIDIDHFRDFPAAVEKLPTELKDQPIVMFCTGGIRCEKASAYMLSQGFPEVYHLEGGILKYLETVPPEQSLWEGECFVFDRRVAVEHGVKQGSYVMCFDCGAPIAANAPSCPNCSVGDEL